MQNSLRFSLFAALLLGLVVRAHSAEYLTSSSVDAVKLLPAPPSADSAETKAELKLLARLQKHRTPEEVERCKAEAKLDMSAFRPVFGAWFTAENLPELDKLFKQIHKESKAATDSAKQHFGRSRPGKLDPDSDPAVAADDEPSYPSGHSTRGIIYAMILSDVCPEKKDALLERGREIGWDRVIAGVHYPSDVAAGRTLGQALGQVLLANPTFREQLAKVKTEFEKAQFNPAESAVAP